MKNSPDFDFLHWFNEKTKLYGVLVTPSTAAKLLGVRRQYIEKIVSAGRLTKLRYGQLVFLGMNEINAEKIRRDDLSLRFRQRCFRAGLMLFSLGADGCPLQDSSSTPKK